MDEAADYVGELIQSKNALDTGAKAAKSLQGDGGRGIMGETKYSTKLGGNYVKSEDVFRAKFSGEVQEGQYIELSPREKSFISHGIKSGDGIFYPGAKQGHISTTNYTYLFKTAGDTVVVTDVISAEEVDFHDESEGVYCDSRGKGGTQERTGRAVSSLEGAGLEQRDGAGHLLVGPQAGTLEADGGVAPGEQNRNAGGDQRQGGGTEQFSLKGASFLDREITRIREEGVAAGRSAADIDADIRQLVDETIQKLREDYGVIKPGEKPAREVEVPRRTSKEEKVSQTVQATRRRHPRAHRPGREEKIRRRRP